MWRVACAGWPASRPLRCSDTRCASLAPTAAGSRRPSRRSQASPGAKLSRGSRTSSSINWPQRRRTNERLLAPAPGLTAAQGMDPGAARSHDAAHHHRAADHAALAVRLRHQCQSQAPADRPPRRRALEIRADHRGEQPTVLIDADATDPTAIGNATAALSALTTSLNRDLPPNRQVQVATPPFQFVVHARYNPEQLTVINIVPGLICMVLTMSTLFITTLSITRERERGTMENLMAMPVRPIEIMLAKIVPYIVIGYIQVVLILAVSAVVFQLPIRGSVPVLLFALGLFIASNLALGLTFSTVATNQLQ